MEESIKSAFILLEHLVCLLFSSKLLSRRRSCMSNSFSMFNSDSNPESSFCFESFSPFYSFSSIVCYFPNFTSLSSLNYLDPNLGVLSFLPLSSFNNRLWLFLLLLFKNDLSALRRSRASLIPAIVLSRLDLSAQSRVSFNLCHFDVFLSRTFIACSFFAWFS